MFIGLYLNGISQNCYCCKKQASGQKEYDAGRYKAAIEEWKRGQSTSDPEKCPDLLKKIQKAQNQLQNIDSSPSKEADLKPNMPFWLVFVSGGTYQMGDVLGDKIFEDELLHKVTISDFYISKYEVSFAEYDAFCIATKRPKPDDLGWGRGRHPVISISWFDAIEYCNWFSLKEGLMPCYKITKSAEGLGVSKNEHQNAVIVTCNWNTNGYRLPTEAEWEYAARAVENPATGEVECGSNIRFGNGRNVLDPTESNFDARSEYRKTFSISGEYRERTVPIDEFGANALGIKNMSGNVWEFCWDWYGENFYAESNDARNPRGPASGTQRVLRGGSWYWNPEFCRTSTRSRFDPNLNLNMAGFRLVRGK